MRHATHDFAASSRYAPGVTRLRALAHRYPVAAALVVVAALLLRLAVPAGFMPVVEHGRLTVLICPGTGTVTGTGTAQAAAGTPHGMHHPDKADRPASPCAFADLSLQATGGTDPIRLADAIRHAFVAALLLAVAVAARATPRLRPPLRGPPLPA